MEEFKVQLVNALQDIIHTLSQRTNYNDREVCAMRLELLAESAFSNDAIPLEAVDGINEAAHLLKSSLNIATRYNPYQAQLESNARKQGRPKYFITEEQLIFFRGKIGCCTLNG